MPEGQEAAEPLKIVPGVDLDEMREALDELDGLLVARSRSEATALYDLVTLHLEDFFVTVRRIRGAPGTYELHTEADVLPAFRDFLAAVRAGKSEQDIRDIFGDR